MGNDEVNFLEQEVIVVGWDCDAAAAALFCAQRAHTRLLAPDVPSFARGRFTFAADPASGFFLRDTLRILSADVPSSDTLACVYPPEGAPFLLPTGKEAFCAALRKAFAGAAIGRLLEICEQSSLLLDKLVLEQRSTLALAARFGQAARLAAYPVREVLTALELPQPLQDVLTAYWRATGLDPTRWEFLPFAALLHRLVHAGVSACSADALRSAFAQAGGVLNTGRARSLLTRQGHATGIKTASGRELPADGILLGRTHGLPSLPAATPAALPFVVYLGLDCPAAQLGFHQPITLLAGEQPAVAFGNARTLCLYQCVPSADWAGTQPKAYHARKAQAAEALIYTFEQALQVKFKPHLQEVVCATPATFARHGWQPRALHMPQLMALRGAPQMPGLRCCAGTADLAARALLADLTGGKRP